MNHLQFVKFLEKSKACSEAVQVVKENKWTMKQAWDNSSRADWMMWLYSKRKPIKKKAVMVAIYSSRLCLKDFEIKYPEDKRPRQAIEAAEKVLEKDNEENRSAAESAAESAARSAAWSALSAAESAAESARSAARSAAMSAARSAAESAARSAAWSALSAARSAAESARSAARSAAANHKLICDYIRKIIPVMK